MYYIQRFWIFKVVYMPLLSFVIPCYRSEMTISKVVDEIVNTVSEKSQYDYEIIAVNDYSPDDVYSVLVNLASKNKRIKVINFAKNMGKHSAIMAGFSFVSGDYIVNIDDDYQCPVNNLWRLLEPVENDICDVATAHYSKKKETNKLKIYQKNINLNQKFEMNFNKVFDKSRNFSLIFKIN